MPPKIVVVELAYSAQEGQSGTSSIDRADVEAFLNPRVVLSKKCEERVKAFLRRLLEAGRT